MAESAKGKVNVRLPDKQRRPRRAERIAALAEPAKAEEARFESAARFSVSKHVSNVCLPDHLSLINPNPNPNPSASHRFDSELNRPAAEIGCQGGEEGDNAPIFRQTVQARQHPTPARNQETAQPCHTHHRPHMCS